MSGGGHLGYLDDLPELVQDSRLQAAFGADGHQGYTTHPALGGRRGRANVEKWFHMKSLGQGGQGSVDLQIRRADTATVPQYRAVKKIAKSNNAQEIELHRRELIAIFKFSQAKYLDLFVRSHGWYTSQDHIHLAMEYLELGDLQHYMTDSSRCPHGRLSDKDTQIIASQVLDALLAMHQEGFSHRDLKPANILIKNQPPNPWWVKLADFGISKRGGEVTQRTAVHGTPNFIPPELLGFAGDSAVTYSFAIDMWCFGETLFRIIVGNGTFKDLRTLISYCQGHSGFPADNLTESGASENTVSFVSSLMAVDPKQRLTALTASDHPWMIAAWKEDDQQTNVPVVSSTQTPLQNETVISTASASWTAVLAQGETQLNQTLRPASNSATLIPANRQAPALSINREEPLTDPSSVSKNATGATQASNSWTAVLPVVSNKDAHRSTRHEQQKSTPSQLSTSSFAIDSMSTSQEEQDARNKVEKYSRSKGRNHPYTIEAKWDLAFRLAQQKQYKEAYELHEEVFNRRLRLASGDKSSEEVQESTHALADVARHLQKYDVAANLFLDLHRVGLEKYGAANPVVIHNLESHAGMLVKQNKIEEALAVHRETVELWRRLPDRKADYLRCQMDLGYGLSLLGREPEVESLAREIIPLGRALWEEQPRQVHEYVVVELLLMLGSSLHAQARNRESEPIFDEAVKLMRRLPKDGNKRDIFMLEALESLSHSRWVQNKTNSKTERLWREYLDFQGTLLGAKDPGRLEDMSFFADFLRRRGKLEEAEVIFREIQTLMGEVLGKEHRSAVLHQERLATLFMDQRLYREAELLIEEALQLRRTLGHEDTIIANTSMLLSACRTKLGKS